MTVKFRIGVACVLFNEKGEILLQKRLKSPGAGLFTLVGGSMDETDPEAAMRREIKEELGIEVVTLHPCHFTAPEMHDDVVMLYFWADGIPSDAPKNMEPEKCGGLEWASPELLFDLRGPAMWKTDLEAARAACIDLTNLYQRSRVNSLYDAIKHGDQLHRQWLQAAIRAHFNGEPIPNEEEVWAKNEK